MGSIKSLGLLKDIKNGEYHVVLTPAEVATLADDGISVMVASGAGYKAGFNDEDYAKAGAEITTNEEIWKSCDFVTKVKEIEPAPPATKTKSDNIYPEFGDRG